MRKSYLVILCITMLLWACSSTTTKTSKIQDIRHTTNEISNTGISLSQWNEDREIGEQPRKMPLFKKIWNTYAFTQTGNYENTGTITLLLWKDGYYYLTPKIRVYNPEECDNTEGLFDWADEWVSWLSWGFSRDLFDLVRNNTWSGSVGCFDTKSYKSFENSHIDASDNEDKNGTYFIGGEETWHPQLRWTTQTGWVADTHDGRLTRFPDGSLYFYIHKLDGITNSKQITSIDNECIKSREKVWCNFYGIVRWTLAPSFRNKKGALYIDENNCYIIKDNSVSYLEACHPKNIHCDTNEGICSDDRFVWDINWDKWYRIYQRSKK